MAPEDNEHTQPWEKDIEDIMRHAQGSVQITGDLKKLDLREDAIVVTMELPLKPVLAGILVELKRRGQVVITLTSEQLGFDSLEQ